MTDLRKSYFRDASGRLTFEIFGIPADDYMALVEQVVTHASLMPLSLPVLGLDVTSTKFSKGSQQISLDWDNWSGFIITALTPESEPLVLELGEYLLDANL